MEPKDRIIVALDVDTVDKALALVRDLAPHVSCFKLGLEFINSMLVSLILPKNPEQAEGELKKIRYLFSLLTDKIFWDGKFADIPNTVCGASRAVVALKVKMFNVHASAGIEAMANAVAASNHTSLVLAVTVLTSLEENNAHLIFGAPSKAKVLQLARDAMLTGCDGVVCSPQELELLAKQRELKNLMKVTPGVRPEWAVAGDQKRIMTPAEAIKAGATAVVIGRPITQPPPQIGTPVNAVEQIALEISAVV